jgi:hypothetical protein
MAAKAAPEARARVLEAGVAPQAQPRLYSAATNVASVHTASVTPKKQESPAQQPAVDEAAPTYSSRHDSAIWWLCTQRERRQHIGADVERQHLKHTDRERQLSAGQRPGRKGCEFGDIVGQVIGQEASYVGEGCPAELDCLTMVAK